MSNARFSILQARAVKDKRISDSQFRTLAALGMYADEDGWCFPMLSTLGKDLSKSKQAVGRDTIALRKLGYLEVLARFNENGGRRSSMYRLRYDLPPRQPDVDTPSTLSVDTPSTSEVDVNDPTNDPNKITLSEKELEEVNKKVDKILELNNPQAFHWQGRENFRDNHLLYADWYNKKTNQICPKKYLKSWKKAFSDWQDGGVEIRHLESAYEQDISWRKVFTDPNELTKKAIALKAAMGEVPAPRTESSGHYA